MNTKLYQMNRLHSELLLNYKDLSLTLPCLIQHLPSFSHFSDEKTQTQICPDSYNKLVEVLEFKARFLYLYFRVSLLPGL